LGEGVPASHPLALAARGGLRQGGDAREPEDSPARRPRDWMLEELLEASRLSGEELGGVPAAGGGSTRRTRRVGARIVAGARREAELGARWSDARRIQELERAHGRKAPVRASSARARAWGGLRPEAPAPRERAVLRPAARPRDNPIPESLYRTPKHRREVDERARRPERRARGIRSWNPLDDLTQDPAERSEQAGPAAWASWSRRWPGHSRNCGPDRRVLSGPGRIVTTSSRDAE
jgi:hypothetical protein